MSGEVKDMGEGTGGALSQAGEPPRYGFTYDMTDVNDTDPKLSHNGLLDKGGAAGFHRQLVKGDLSSEYASERYTENIET